MYVFEKNKFSTIIKYSEPPGGVKRSLDGVNTARVQSRGLRGEQNLDWQVNVGNPIECPIAN